MTWIKDYSCKYTYKLSRQVQNIPNLILSFISSSCFEMKMFSKASRKEVVHSGHLLTYLLAASEHNMTLKTLQPGHWEVKDFLTQNYLPFFNPYYQPQVLQK